jgi:hypothetical protein
LDTHPRKGTVTVRDIVINQVDEQGFWYEYDDPTEVEGKEKGIAFFGFWPRMGSNAVWFQGAL